MKSIYLYTAIGLALGCMVPIQSAVNSQLGQQLKHPLQASFTSFLVGTLVLAIILTVFDIGFPFTKQLGQTSWYLFTGGVMGAIFVSTVIVLIPRSGTLVILSSTVAGQLILAAVADHFGWFGLPHNPISFQRVVGIILLISGVLLVHK